MCVCAYVEHTYMLIHICTYTYVAHSSQFIVFIPQIVRRPICGIHIYKYVYILYVYSICKKFLHWELTRTDHRNFSRFREPLADYVGNFISLKSNAKLLGPKIGERLKHLWLFTYVNSWPTLAKIRRPRPRPTDSRILIWTTTS